MLRKYKLRYTIQKYLAKGENMQLLVFLMLFVFYSCASLANEHSFQNVWNQVTSDPLSTLPQETVSFSKLFSWSKNIILDNANRTLVEHADILEPFDKLAHPNGICFKGIWEIHKENHYSGYFTNHTKALIIVRASSAMSNTHRGEIRAFGFAGKIFPSLNPLEINEEHTANFFLIDDLVGQMPNITQM